MKTVYTTTITSEAQKRGIAIKIIDPHTPVFILKHRDKAIRCYNSLTDKVGAVSFFLANNKHCANQFLSQNGFSVPRQHKYSSLKDARTFLDKIGCIVVKPCNEWGGRGVSVAVRTAAELRAALRRARTFGENILLEECVSGTDIRIIVVDGRAVAAIVREPASVCGNGRDSCKKLIMARNRITTRVDPSNKIPLDAETRRTLRCAGLDWGAVPRAGRVVMARRTTNFHTGGSVTDISDRIPKNLAVIACRVAALFNIAVMGVDFLVDEKRKKYWIIEASPDMAISPPEGARVARHFIDYLFPGTKQAKRRL